ncbi:MAG: TetR/AcrR family transcriptional regulator [Oscillospiraceae bacterium]|nr:TetR/AcrR family transcriptional regulator [Oscillospiraceae bacterium]
MPKGSPELTNARKEEIINACEELYKTMSFKEITMKEISEVTSFTRTSIYNYFQTKEEIFLALLQREYELWIADLNEIMEKYPALSKEEFADNLARSLEKREQLLKIMSMNHYDMESSSRQERLTEFKVAYGKSLNTVMRCLEQYFPDMPVSNKKNFLYTFFPFMFGIYPYTVVNEKQRTAMEEAGVNYVFMTIYEITYNFIKCLLKN